MNRAAASHATALTALTTLAVSCERAATPPPQPPPERDGQAAWFTDVTNDVGLRFEHETGWRGDYFFPEIAGSGCALLDYDGDGDLDVYLINGARHADGKVQPHGDVRNRLFRRESDGRYTDVTEASGLGDTGYGMGCAVGDFDGDDDLDVFVTNYGPNKLYANNGDGTFTDVTAPAGITQTADGSWSCSAAFVDYDGDGRLDVYVANYLQYDPDKTCRDRSGGREYCGPMAFQGSPDALYHNNGDGTFTAAGSVAGIGAVRGRGLGLVCYDFNDDGLTDIYVANDGEANFLWINRGDGRFRDDALMYGVGLNAMGQAEASMGVALGDVDGDGFADLFCTHLRDESNTLYRGGGAMGFEDVTGTSGLAAASMAYTGFGTGFCDVDLDGDLDVIVVNGRVQRGRPSVDDPDNPLRRGYAEPNQLFVNDGTGRFTDMSERGGALCGLAGVSRGLAFGDIDRDGDLDVLISNGGGRAGLFRNDAPKRGHWLMVDACEMGRRHQALGAKIVVEANGRRFTRTVLAAASYLSSHAMSAHFGLGEAAEVTGIVVTWPGGDVESFDGGAADRYVRVEHGRGRPVPAGASE